jgi:hypothetical protein
MVAWVHRGCNPHRRGAPSYLPITSGYGKRSATGFSIRVVLLADELGDSDPTGPARTHGRSLIACQGMVSVPTRIAVSMPSMALTLTAEL